MKVSKLELENIKCFEKLEISFEDKNWSLIVGDNGQGKTTILRCLAIGLCDKAGASGLLVELHGGLLRQGKKKGFIKVFLKNDEQEQTAIIKTTIKLDGRNESITQECTDESNEKLSSDEMDEIRGKIFAVAYGSGRTITGTESYEEYAIVDSVYGLFNYDHGLQNPELGMRRISQEGEDKFEKLKNILKEILMLSKDSQINLNKKGLFVENGWGNISFNALSDGYQSMTAVILDFLSWRLLDDELDLDKISGIFIIDELEQHLHPKWQRNIIKTLSKQFPKIQFICSTHSPICSLGLSDLECESQLVKVAYVDKHSEAEIFDLKEDFKGYRADQILTSDIFSISDTRSISIEDKLKEYKKIYLKKEENRSEAEKKSFGEIENELENLPMWENMKDREQREELIKLLKSKKTIKK